MSNFEKEFEGFFKKKNLEFTRNARNLKGTPDFVFSMNGYDRVLFLHGCYWHGHNCKEWKLSKVGLSRQAVTKVKDREVRQHYIGDPNSLYIRCWECDYLANKESQLNQIYNTVISD